MYAFPRPYSTIMTVYLHAKHKLWRREDTALNPLYAAYFTVSLDMLFDFNSSSVNGNNISELEAFCEDVMT